MPNYILSRTSPPAHIYERKINLGYGIKVDTSDAPTAEPKKEKKMEDVKTTLDVADKPVNPVIFADGTAAPLEAQEAEEAKDAAVNG